MAQRQQERSEAATTTEGVRRELKQRQDELYRTETALMNEREAAKVDSDAFEKRLASSSKELEESRARSAAQIDVCSARPGNRNHRATPAEQHLRGQDTETVLDLQLVFRGASAEDPAVCFARTGFICTGA